MNIFTKEDYIYNTYMTILSTGKWLILIWFSGKTFLI